MTEIRWMLLDNDPDGYKYQAVNTYMYYSPRYNRSSTVTQGDRSDGATGAWDINSDAWGVHDQICKTGKWDDGTPLCNWDASTVLGDILWSEGRYYRAVYWWLATFLGGGGQARKNGMWRVKK